MRKKNSILLTALSIVMIGLFLVVSNLEPPDIPLDPAVEEELRAAQEELKAIQEAELLQDINIPESPGYAWNDANGKALAYSMDISDLENYPVYYFSVPDNVRKYQEDIAKELLGGDYEDAETSSEHMSADIFPGWDNIVTYRLPDALSTKLAVSLHHVSYNDSRQAGTPDKRADADLTRLTEEYLKKFQWGFWDGKNSCSVLKEKNGDIEVSSVLAGLPADKYLDNMQKTHKDGYFYSAGRNKMVFAYHGEHLSGLEFVFSGTLSRKEKLPKRYTSVQEIIDIIKNCKEKEAVQINSAATDPIYTLFDPHSAEYCYITGLHPDHPEYKASPWLVVTGTDNIYLFKDKKWQKYEDVHIGINLSTGEVRNVSELNI